MRKRLALILILCLVVSCLTTAIVACKDDNGNKTANTIPSAYNEDADMTVDDTSPRFKYDNYEITNGSKVTAEGKATYFIVGKGVQGVSVTEKGVFSVASNVPNGAQVLLGAKSGGVMTDTTVCTVVQKVEKPTLEFTNLSQFMVDGDHAEAFATPSYAVSYSLKSNYVGIKINPVSGKISYTEAVSDGTPFTVVASSHGESVEMDFITAVGNYVTVENDEVIAELGVGLDVRFTLDFGSNAEAETQGVLGVIRGRNRLNADTDYTYDETTHTITITEQYAASLSMGINILRVFTAKNAVTVYVKIAKYVTTAEELAEINASQENLRGHYVLACDIDLTNYLSVNGKGYDKGNRWKPIGVYHDVLDGTATDWAFAGEFDGNGHTISGLVIERGDNYAFNSGLFGCIAMSGVVKNLGVRGRTNVRSFSGGMVGYNLGKVYDCWADVDVTADGCRILGGFVGKNEGTVRNCYSLGKAAGESSIGSFCGQNLGVITDCVALQNESYPFVADGSADNCALADTQANLAKKDYSTWTNWNWTSGSMPTLPSMELVYPLKSVVVHNTETYLTRGDTLQLNVTTNPQSAAADGLTYEIIEGVNATVTQTGLLSVRSATAGQYVTVRVTCGTVYTDYTVWVYAKPDLNTTAFADTEDVMYADCHYRVSVLVQPAEANQQVAYSLTGAPQGVTIKGDVISIAPDVKSGSFTLVATLDTGDKITKVITVVGDTLIELPPDQSQKDRDNLTDLVITLPESGLTVTSVKIFGKAVSFTVQGDTVTVKGSEFLKYGKEPISILIETASGEKFRATVYLS